MELQVGLVEYVAAEARGFVDGLAGALACQTWKHPVSAWALSQSSSTKL